MSSMFGASYLLTIKTKSRTGKVKRCESSTVLRLQQTRGRKIIDCRRVGGTEHPDTYALQE